MDQDPSATAKVRRAAVAKVSRDFALVDDLVTLLGVAEYGLAALFNGECTIQLGAGADAQIASGGALVPCDQATPHIAAGLAGQPSPDVISLRPGILLVPESSTGECRAWIQFPTPRQLSVEELIIADLLAQAFAIAVDRLVDHQHAAEREEHLKQAIDGNRTIGQAAGILVERHRITPAAAFELLKAASQHRNIKLRDLAVRVIDTGQEPHLA